MMRTLLAVASSALVLSTPVVAQAFCGFYVAPNDKPLYNDASMVALMRAGTRTALSMSNTYAGPPENFAMVVPVPVVLRKENVRTLPLDLFAKLETLTAPRLVEYWEQDPCSDGGRGDGIGLGSIGGLSGSGTGMGYGGGGGKVTVEAQFTVGEYEIVILSATESEALETWLRHNQYKIPAGASAALAPYVKEQQKFFVAKVDATKVKRNDQGVVTLSPLRFDYESTDFRLPVRLGLLNSTGAQDLLVFILADARYEVANYPNVYAPTNLDVIDDTRQHFGAFYAKLFDATLAKAGSKAVVTEYAWPPQSCDPCPGPNVILSGNDLATLGSDVVHPSSTKKKVVKMIEVGPDIVGKLPAEVVKRIVRSNFPRFRACYQAGLAKDPTLSGIVSTTFEIDATGASKNAKSNKSTLKDEGVVACVRSVFGGLTFPEPEGGTVKVTYPIAFEDDDASFAVSGADLIITRLHTRYSPATLGEDLVFRTAPPVVGGREERDDKGVLEHSAKPASANSFQARYAIRHAWNGPIKCDKPVRGRFGGPPTGTAPAQPTAAKDLAHADRTALSLASYVTSGLDDPPSYDKAAAQLPVTKTGDPKLEPKVEPTPAVKKRACGCEVPRASSSGEGVFAASIVLLGLIRRLARSR